MDERISEVRLYAWVGEDELGSGVVGIKQALTRAGLIPLVSIEREKLQQVSITRSLQDQVRCFGKPIHLCAFTFEGILETLKPGEDR